MILACSLVALILSVILIQNRKVLRQKMFKKCEFKDKIGSDHPESVDSGRSLIQEDPGYKRKNI